MPRKCALCNEIIKDDEYESNCMPYKKRYVHITCFNASVKAVAVDKKEKLEKKKEEIEGNKKGKKKQIRTPKAELKDGMSDEEYKEKREYYDYLKQILNTDKLSAKTYTLSDKYIHQFEWTWRGMRDALVYLHEIKEKEITEDIVGYLPYIYDDSLRFFEEVKRVEENNKEAPLSDMYKTKRIVYRKRPQKTIEDLEIESINKSK